MSKTENGNDGLRRCGRSLYGYGNGVQHAMRRLLLVFLVAAIPLQADGGAQGNEYLPGTQPLTSTEDFPVAMATGIERYFDREIARSVEERKRFWAPDFSSAEKYEASVAENRARFARTIGLVDARLANPELEYIATTSRPAQLADTEKYTVYAVRWPVFDGVHGEGLLVQPKGSIRARIVALPDADQMPEAIAGLLADVPREFQYARRLAENGCLIIIPTLLDRSNARSRNDALGLYTNQTHREWIYRQAITFGRHVIGYEVHKVLAAVDWFARQDAGKPLPVGVVGWGEGGLIALYSAAADTRIEGVAVSGYFAPREKMWTEPNYRSVFGMLREFGDAGVARLIAPRTLIVEYARSPEVKGPPPGSSWPYPNSASPGVLTTAAYEDVAAEIARARQQCGPFARSIHLVHEGETPATGIGEASLLTFLRQLTAVTRLDPPGADPALDSAVDTVARQHRQLSELEKYSQSLIERGRTARDEFLWKKVPITTPQAWAAAMQEYRVRLWDQVWGRLRPEATALNPRSRKFMETDKWTGYEVVLDIRPEILLWSYVLVPKSIKAGERRPVIVGRGGVPADVIDRNPAHRAARTYNAFGAKLADLGFIVVAPHLPVEIRQSQRKANSVGLSIYSVLFEQHERLLDWLTAQPQVDARRIGFYGLSYGGKVAERVGAAIDRYALLISSGNFNEWGWKVATTGFRASYLFANEYEMFDYNLNVTFSSAELAALIAPRPFMVERGHDDGVGIDEWVAFEYAKVNRLYGKLGIPDRTRIEYFNGPHVIHGVGTFEFIQHHFAWPPPGKSTTDRSVPGRAAPLER